MTTPRLPCCDGRGFVAPDLSTVHLWQDCSMPQGALAAALWPGSKWCCDDGFRRFPATPTNRGTLTICSRGRLRNEFLLPRRPPRVLFPAGHQMKHWSVVPTLAPYGPSAAAPQKREISRPALSSGGPCFYTETAATTAVAALCRSSALCSILARRRQRLPPAAVADQLRHTITRRFPAFA